MRNQEIKPQELPPTLRSFIRRYPRLWKAHERLGVESMRAGPLDEKQIQLIKLAVAGSLMLETPFKTHVKKAIREKATRAEIEHTIILSLPTVGMGRTMMTMKWYNEVSRKPRRQLGQIDLA